MTPTPPSPFAGPSSVLGTAQTRLARSRPLGSLVGRLLLGLTLLTGGSAAAWFSVSSGLRDGLHATDTVQTVPRAQAQALQAELTTDRGELAVTALPASATTQGLAAELRAHHRQFNPLHVTAAPAQGGEGAKAHTLSLHSQLLVDPPASPGVLSFQPPGVAVEHRLAARLAPGLPLSLSARAGSGDLELDLRRLKLRSLTTVSRSGDQTVQLPAQNLGRVRLSTTSGDV
ncbi:MAG: hypothetical protein Q4C67_10740, partial [Deinococcus sp.]|nr:hypothetical protein [Deinococcus sp.]